jgi:hypothetical protein
MSARCPGAPSEPHTFHPVQVAPSKRRCVEHGALLLYVQGYRRCSACFWATWWTEAVCPQVALDAGQVAEAFAMAQVARKGCPRCARSSAAA